MHSWNKVSFDNYFKEYIDSRDKMIIGTIAIQNQTVIWIKLYKIIIKDQMIIKIIVSIPY